MQRMSPSETQSFEVIGVAEPLPSPMRSPDATPGRRLRIGAVQCAWSPDASGLSATLDNGIAIAAEHGAEMVCLQELTLSPYFCSRPDVPDALERFGEDLESGPTITFARAAAARHQIVVHASLYERTPDGHGYNTAICVDPSGALLARTRKTHIPAFPWYHEDQYFEPADADCPVDSVLGVGFAFPTCWDQWFPELARAVSMAGAEVVVYPTAIGSEPHLPEADTALMWRQMISANGLANSTFMVAVNRIGDESPLSFYGSSFISDPYGRVLVEAPRDRPAVLIADLDLAQRADMLSWGLLYTRQPDRYRTLIAASNLGRPAEPEGVHT